MVQNFPSKGLLGSDRQKCDVFPGQLSPGKLWQRDWYFQEITRWKNRSWSIWQSLFCSDYAYRKILKIFWHFQIILWSQALRWPKRVHTHFVNTNMAEISWYVRGNSALFSVSQLKTNDKCFLHNEETVLSREAASRPESWKVKWLTFINILNGS